MKKFYENDDPVITRSTGDCQYNMCTECDHIDKLERCIRIRDHVIKGLELENELLKKKLKAIREINANSSALITSMSINKKEQTNEKR